MNPSPLLLTTPTRTRRNSMGSNLLEKRLGKSFSLTLMPTNDAKTVKTEEEKKNSNSESERSESVSERSFGSAISCASVVLGKYQKGEHIGSGFQGSVFKSKRIADGKELIMKVMSTKDHINEERAHNEI